MTEETTEETTRQKIERSLKENPDPYVRKFLDDSDAYLNKWDEDQKKREEELREKEIEERQDKSVFEDTQNQDEHKERGLLTHPPNPLSDRHPYFKSLTVHQVGRIQQCFEEGLSLRDTKRSLHVFENLDISIGTLSAIKKKMKQSV